MEGATAVLETLKGAEDGRGLILRLYEPLGGRGQVTVTTDLPVSKVVECNHVEQDAAELPLAGNSFSFAIGPFQIRTFRLLA